MQASTMVHQDPQLQSSDCAVKAKVISKFKIPMVKHKRQLKISKLIRGGGVTKSKSTARKPVDETDDLQEEIKLLEEKLHDKQNEYFQLLRNKQKLKLMPLSKSKKKDEVFITPQEIVLKTQVEKLRRSMDGVIMLTGIEVQSFQEGDHCCVVFHMQHDSKHVVKHGLRIEMKGGTNEISALNLPLGFKLNAVMEEYDHNVKKPQCLMAIRKALFAYYDRFQQFEALKKQVNIEAELFRTMDTSHVQIKITIQNELEEADEAEHFCVVLLLDYRVYDIRPKCFAIKDTEDFPEEMVEAVTKQMTVFKKVPLHKAFKEAFVSGGGNYKLVRQYGACDMPRPRAGRRRRRPRPNYNNDDTFHPEECSEFDDDDDDIIE